MRDTEGKKTMSASGSIRQIVLVPKSLGCAGQLKGATALKVGDDDSGASVHAEVAKRIEHAVARVIGDAQSAVIQYLNETGRATAVGGWCNSPLFTTAIASVEECKQQS
jgi:hypothetical protein